MTMYDHVWLIKGKQKVKNKAFTISEQVMSSQGHVMSNSWKIHDQVMEKWRTSYKQIMNE